MDRADEAGAGGHAGAVTRAGAASPWRGGPGLRLALGVGAAANLALAVALTLEVPWAVAVWPWTTGPLSLRFLAAMLAAIAAGAAWIAVSGDLDALPAGFLNLAITSGGSGVGLLLGGTDRGIASALLVAGAANLLLASASDRRVTAAGDAPIPDVVRATYAAFTVVLLAVGLALLAGLDRVLPWPVEGQTALVFGWIFLGDAAYFAVGVARPRWRAGRAQLWSFLAYDLVLAPALLLHLRDVPPERLASTVVYLAVLAFSAVLAIRYAVVDLVRRPRSSASA